MSAAERVRAAYAAIAAAGRAEVWITLRPESEALDEAALVDARVAAGDRLPLAGLVTAVKDNIDVAGLPTTAGAPSYAYLPSRDATSVARIRAAGAVVLGKTNLDQFATGLVGTRSPYGAVRSAWDPRRISGGSSSGSAVAVALGLVDFALGTDTAGSGRVPAALNGVVGIKPTRGLIPCTGVVPACRSLDCVAVFARSLSLARLAVAIMSGPDGIDPLATFRGATSPAGGWDPVAGRVDAASVRTRGPRLAIPLPAQLGDLADGWAESFSDVCARFRACGAEIAAVDIAPLLEAAALLYGGAFVAERYAAVGRHIAAREDLVGDTLDPVVAAIILDGAKHDAAAYFADREHLDRLALAAATALAGFDALLTPATTAHPTLDEVRADPVGVSARLGRYTNFCNLLDLAALAVPGRTTATGMFGIMLTGPAGSDDSLAKIAELYDDQDDTELLVVGAHLSGQPLNHELLAAGGALIGPAATAPSYRLYALDTAPPKPGLVRVPGAARDGAAIRAELWRLPAAGLARFMRGLASPMVIGRVLLDDGREVHGFLCEPAALDGAADITPYGGWLAYLAAGSGSARPAGAPLR
ncbi:MAG TPA: allophanate hydrolase [Trebonia sp.]|jgi:allophanate hydrolase